MDNDAVRSCVIDIPKPRVYSEKPKTVVSCHKLKHLDKTVRQPSDTSRRYSLSEELPLRRRTYGNNEILLSFSQFAKHQRRVRQKQKLSISVSERYKIISTDLRNRLYVEKSPNDVNTIKDVDDDFFNCVNGRVLSHRGPHFKSLSSLFDYRLRKKIEIGYRNDTIFNIGLNFIKERETYDVTVAKYTEQVKYLDQFILEDYQHSMEFLEKWEEVKKKVQLKNIELQYLASEIFTTTSKLILLDYRYGQQQKYGRFLYYLSSPTWRAQNREFAQSIEIEATGFDLGNSNDDDSISVLLQKMQMECVRSFVKPVLYFVQPSDLMAVFETIETQERYHFMHVSRMAPLAKSLDRARTLLKQKVLQDTAAVVSTIKGFEAEVNFYYERSKQLEEKFFQVLHGFYYQNVGSLDVLKFTLHLEFCFEKLFNEKPINMDLRGMTKAIESSLMVNVCKLECLQGPNLKQAIRKNMIEEKLKDKKSKEAAKELRLFARIENELLKSFAPVQKKREMATIPEKIVSYKDNIGLQKRSRSKVASTAAKKITLTESEREYLLLFTDWKEYEDPSLYLHSS